MTKKITYLKRGNKYLVIKEDGTTELLESKVFFNKYLTDNNYTIT